MKESISHTYKIIKCDDQSPMYNIAHIESKNPATFWRTFTTTEYAYFEIKFTPIKLHHIDIINSLSPQIEVEAFNRNAANEEIDNFTCVPKVTLKNHNDVMEGKNDAKPRKFDLTHSILMPKNVLYTHMRVHVYNPFHDKKPVYLGLNSFIIFATNQDNRLTTPPKSTLRREQDYISNEDFMNKLRINNPQEQRSFNNPELDFLRNRSPGRGGMFKDRIEPPRDPSNVNSLLNTRPGWNNSNKTSTNKLKRYIDDVHGGDDPLGIADRANELKRVKANWMNDSRQGDPIRMQFNKRSEPKPRITDDEFQRVLRASEETARKENEQRQERIRREKQFLSEPTRKNFKSRLEREENDENTTDMEEFKRAMAASMETYNEGKGYVEERDTSDEEKEEDYVRMLETYAEQDFMEDSQSREFIAMKEMEKNGKEEHTSDTATERIEESEGEDWDDDDKENQEWKKNVMMEIDMPMSPERKGKKGRKVSNEEDWYSYRLADTMEMFSLNENDLDPKFIKNELKVQKEFEKKNNRGNQIEVVNSHHNIMKGVVLCLGGFHGEEKTKLKDMGIAMGARVLDDLYEGITTHLVTEDPSSFKYKNAEEMKIFITTKDWVQQCYDHKKRLDERNYLLTKLKEEEEAEQDPFVKMEADPFMKVEQEFQ